MANSNNSSIDLSQVGSRIKSIRISKGLTMDDFGLLFHTSKGTVNNWEKGRNLPNKENLKAIADLEEISVNELLYGSTWEYAHKKINEICEKYKISDSYFYNLYDSLSEDGKNIIKKEYPNAHVKTAIINYILIRDAESKFKLSYETIDTKGFEIAFLNKIGFNAAMQDLTLKEKILQYLNEITDIEIKSFQNQKYKVFYDYRSKEDALKFMLTHYSFDNLTDIGIKSWTKELAEIYLDRLELFKNYKPFNDSNAVQFAKDQLWYSTIHNVDEYFKSDKIENNNNSLEPNMIKEGLSYDLYEQIRIILEDASNKLKELK